MVEYCEKNKYIEDINTKTYVLYDDKYLGTGYFIISEKDDKLVKFVKISIVNSYGFPQYNVRAYEKGSIDKDDQDFRDIEISVERTDCLFDVFKKLSIALNFESILSIDPFEQGQNQLSAYHCEDSASIIFTKDVLNVRNATDFIDINIGDNFCKYWEQFNEFYQDLGNVAIRETKEEDIQKVLKMQS